MLVTLLIGFLFGFIGSMPVAGPLAVIIFARAVDDRFRSAIFIAVGGGLGEAMYAFLAFWGLANLLDAYPQVVPISRGVAAMILIGLGLAFLLRREPSEAAPPVRDRGRYGFALGFSLTALNPTLIATWTAAATSFFSTGLVAFEPALAIPFAGAACVGIVAWFVILLKLVRRYRERFAPETLGKVLRVMGLMLLGFGAWFAWLFVDYLVGG